MEPESSKRECWAVSAGNCFDQEERMVAAGYDNGDVKVGFAIMRMMSSSS